MTDLHQVSMTAARQWRDGDGYSRTRWLSAPCRQDFADLDDLARHYAAHRGKKSIRPDRRWWSVDVFLYDDEGGDAYRYCTTIRLDGLTYAQQCAAGYREQHLRAVVDYIRDWRDVWANELSAAPATAAA